MDFLALYLLGNANALADKLSSLAGLIALAYFAPFGIANAVKYIDTVGREEDINIPFPHVKKVIATCMVLMTLSIFMPSERSVAYMSAYYVGKSVVTSETMGKLVTLVNGKLDEANKKDVPKTGTGTSN